MNPLHLSGWGVKIHVRNLTSRSELEITDGREDNRKESVYRFHPRRFPYSSIIIDGHSGYVSLQAFHWLSRNKVPVFILDYDGSLISSILPPMPGKADLRVAQIHASEDSEKRFAIAHEIVKAKIQRSLDVLHWLSGRYDIGDQTRKTEREVLALTKATSVNGLRMVEGRVAEQYWRAIQSVLPECFCFEGRLIRSGRANNASDPVNLALNYGYGVLEGECRRAINIVGLEPSMGFLHESASYQTKESLVYDMQEPYRWLIDVSVITAFESGILDVPDFYFTGDDYRYHINVEAKTRFMKLLQDTFNTVSRYDGKMCKWDTIILNDAKELCRYLLAKSDLAEFHIYRPEDSIILNHEILIRTKSVVRKSKVQHRIRRQLAQTSNCQVNL